MELELARKVTFESSHRYYRDDWTKEKNKEVFGPCANEHGHGHNYVLDFAVKGPTDPSTGMILNLKDVDDILKDLVSELDQKHLNDLAPFKGQIPTTEVIAIYLWSCAKEKIKKFESVTPVRLRLYENEDLWVDIQE